MLVAICMATYNPHSTLFARQTESLLHQTHQNWICIISDDASSPDSYDYMRRVVERDPRFHIYNNDTRLGFYLNFERCLSLLPEGIEFVCLADQDDCWYPDKIARLLSKFDETIMLVYNDMTVVDENGSILTNSYYRMRSHMNLASLLLTNTVSGAACMFRRELLRHALPFPRYLRPAFHDHWIACVALASGLIRHLDEPLQSYVQHGGQVLGYQVPARLSWADRIWRIIHNFLNSILSREQITSALSHWRQIYMEDVLRVERTAAELDIRFPAMPADKRAIVRRMARLDLSRLALVWLALRWVKSLFTPIDTLGIESQYLRGLIWYYCFRPRTRSDQFQY